MNMLVPAGRLIFGAWLLLGSVNHFFFPFWPLPSPQDPLAAQLLNAFVHSGLLDVAMTIQLVTGALILVGLFVPLALCVVMPVTTCALFWWVILEQQPLGAFIACAAFLLNGLLMLAWIDHYRGALQRRALSLGEE